MANRERGEVDLEVGDKTFILRFTTNSLCDLEDVVGCGIAGFADQLASSDGVKTSSVRLVFWAALQEEHGVSLTEAGEILDQVGIIPGLEKAAEALRLSFPEAEDDVAEKKPPMPKRKKAPRLAGAR